MNSFDGVTKAAISAVEETGFINVCVASDEIDFGSMVSIVVSADCPCGLGQSRFGILLDKRYAIDTRYVYENLRAVAAAHIEHDRAEGRLA